MSSKCIILLIILHICSISGSQDTLLLVNLVYRHGDRSPIEGYPSDDETAADWPQGYGQLTQLGIQQEWQLGQFLRQRYNGFINSSYLREQIYVRSTDYDRTIMSAQAVLSGLYPPGANQQWSKTIAWQPIPVHTVKEDQDQLLSHAPCPKWNNREGVLIRQPEVFNYIRHNYEGFLTEFHESAGYNWSLVAEEHPYKRLIHINDNLLIKEFLSKLFKNAGYPEPFNHTLHTLKLKGLGRIQDNILIKTIHNRKLPDWATNSTMSEVRKILMYLAYVKFNDTASVRLRSGALLEKIVLDMKLKSLGQQLTKIKMFMYSGHDTTVLPLLAAMKVYNNITCPYSTMIMVELHNNTGNLYVQVWLRNDTTREPYLLTIPGCQANCSLDMFVNLTSSMRVHDRYRECVVYTVFGFTSLKNTIIFFSLVSAALLVFVALILALVCHRRCSRTRVIKYKIHENTEIPETLPMMASSGGLSDDD